MPPTPTVELRGAAGRLWDGIEAGRLPPAVLIDGPAGTGKTLSILLCLHLWSLNRGGLRILVARKTREALTESVLVTYEQQVLPITGHEAIAAGILRRVRQSYRYPNGTEWIVGGLDKPSRILSTSFDLGFVNEAIETTETDWETLDSRIGRPERSHGLNCLLGDTNPGDAAHFLKRKADAGELAHWPSRHPDNPALWSRDNGDWTEAGRSYLARLERLTGSRRKRLLSGMWVAGEGAWFDSFDPELHVGATAEFDPDYPVYEAIDPGVHTGVVWFQADTRWGEPRAWVIGDLYLFDVPAQQAARRIVARRHELVGGAAVESYADPAGKQANAIGPKVYEEYERGGLAVELVAGHDRALGARDDRRPGERHAAAAARAPADPRR
jgi:hypothetical protein